MEVAEQADGEQFDFESGIDLWVIDKDKKLEENLRPEIKSIEMKTVDKENIKEHVILASNQSLRCFRMRKSVNYEELSSESESDTTKKYNKKLDSTHFKKANLEKLKSSKVTTKFRHKRTSTSIGSVKNRNKEVGSLSSEEISVVLTEVESSDGIQEKSRETLLSIENVSNSDKNGEFCLSLRSNLRCPICTYGCSSLEELRSHESVHMKDKETSTIQSSEQWAKDSKRNKLLNSDDENWNNDFLDSLKSNLIIEAEVHVNEVGRRRKNKESRLKQLKGTDKVSEKSKKTFVCQVCNYSCREQLIMKTHQILFHSEMKVLKCEYCDYKTSQCANLATHIRVHFLLNCPYCDFHSSFKTSLKNHLLTHHNNKAIYKCKKCPYENQSQFKFQKHVKLHTLPTKYQCGDCKMVHPSKQMLQIHKRKHKSLEKLFKCSNCSLSFSEKPLLKLHERSHKRIYVCHTCNLKFPQKHLLKTHLKVHTLETFKCEKCSSVFSRKNHLTRHMHVHGTSFNKCQHCSFKSSSLSDLLKHICIDKLYNVQKRPLNFKNGNSKNDICKSKLEIVKPEVNQLKVRADRQRDTTNQTEVNTKPTSTKIKKIENKVKVLSRCKNLPSCKSQRIAEIVPDGTKQTKGSKYQTLVKRNGKQQSSNIVQEEKQQLRTRRKRQCNIKQQAPLAKKIRREVLANRLDVGKILFGKKPSSLVETSLSSEVNFVQCFDQNHTCESHLIAQQKLVKLMTCRMCEYKTNSKQLLKAHIAKAHRWDPVIISTFFS